MPLKKNDEITLKIDSLTAEGSGVGRHDGMAVFVSAAAVGDTVSAHIIKAKSNYAVATIKKIIEPSPERIEPDCAAFPRCGGCCFRNMTYKAECEAKKQRVENAFKRLAHLDIKAEAFIASDEYGRYRNKAQLPVGIDDFGHVVTGFFAGRSHRIVSCDDCLLQPESFKTVAEVFTKWADDNSVSVYDEATGKGILRHLYIRQAAATGEIMVCPVISTNRLPASDALVAALKAAVPCLTSVVLNINRDNTNVILGEKCVTLFGRDYIEDILCDVRVRLSPLSFYQVNRAQAQRLYEKAEEYASLKGNETLLDLYCGAGTIGLSMANRIKQLIGVEIVPEAIEDAKLNAQINGIANARFICADAENAAQTLSDEGLAPDVIVLDPPRKGCSAELIACAVRMQPERIVYVSCDPATLARDCAVFASLGYNAMRLTAVDMFPRTAHVETVVLLGRENVDKVQYAYIDYETKDAEYLKGIKGSATYKEIKAWIKQEYDMNVTNLYIAQIKDKCGFAKRDNYNIGSESGRVPTCPPEKEKAILGAFKHFEMM